MEQSTQTQNAILQAAQEAETPPKRSRRPLIAGAVALTLVVVGAGWVLLAPSTEATDDAYIAADATSVAPRVHGLVTQVLVKDHQPVSAGQPLVRIDSEAFDSRVTLAEGDLADSQAQVALAEAALTIQDAEQRLASARVLAARTAIRTNQAESRRAGAERNRFDTLVSTGAVARNEVEKYSTRAISAEQGLAYAQNQLGAMYYYGRGVDSNDDLAAHWFRCAARQGEASAQQNLGLMYKKGRGVPQSEEVALACFAAPPSRACCCRGWPSTARRRAAGGGDHRLRGPEPGADPFQRIAAGGAAGDRGAAGARASALSMGCHLPVMWLGHPRRPGLGPLWITRTS